MDNRAVDTYISSFEGELKARLTQMRRIILNTAPNAIESISYGMPAYKLNGKPLVYFAGYKNHVGFYATPNGHQQFEVEFARYKQGKGSVQLPLNSPLPVQLVQKVVQYRVQQVS